MAILGWSASAGAGEFSIVDVPSIGSDWARPNAIAFSDLEADDAKSPGGLTSFETWSAEKPLQKKLLSPFPSYVEPFADVTVEGVTKKTLEKLRMYVGEARFIVSRPPQEIDLARYANVGFLERLDPAITHRTIDASEVDKDATINPDRAWCAKQANVTCVASKYRLEGKLPMAVQLVKQLTDDDKLSEYLEFQSELRILGVSDVNEAELKALTGIETPVAGAIEQTIFYVNQIMKFGKFLVVFQESPHDPNETVVTAYIALGLKARVLDQAKKYETVPILRNLVPAMVLTGKSSFNAGNSISAGLPVFARNNVKAVAAIVEGPRPSCPSCFGRVACNRTAIRFPSLDAAGSKSTPISMKAQELGPDLLQGCRPWVDPFAARSCQCGRSMLKQASAGDTVGRTSATGIVAVSHACP
jgi:hypothetical protein